MRKTNNPKYIIIHNTGGTKSNPLADTSHHTYEIVNEWHKKKWNYPASNGTYIGYHYFIQKDGFVVKGTPEDEEGMHTIGKNLESIGICLAGNFDLTLPTEAQKQALKALLERLVAKYNITPEHIYPHRQFALTNCYGKKLDSNWARNLLEPEPVDLRPVDELERIVLTKKVAELQKSLIKLLWQKVIQLKRRLLNR